MKISFLQKLCYFSGGSEIAIEVDFAANLPFGFFFDYLDKLFGILMLHAAFDFFQSHLPQIFNRVDLISESKDERAYGAYENYGHERCS
jgi:hypothetical protein